MWPVPGSVVISTFLLPRSAALDLTGVVCPGDVLLNSTQADGKVFRATGEVRLRDAQITRDLNFTNARLHGDDGVEARGLQVGGCLTWVLDPPEGPIDFTGAQISRLKDTAESWPKGRYTLTGMVYQSTSGSTLTLEQRKTWLRQTSLYSPNAYQQLARVYRLTGQESHAQQILIASQRDMRDKTRGHLPWRSRVWSRFIDHFAGYGYKLHRPFVLLLLAGLAGGVIYLGAQHAGLIISTGKSPAPPFYPFPYSFQLLIPSLHLRETANWLPEAGKSGWGLA
jgi:hypothetical protein